MLPGLNKRQVGEAFDPIESDTCDPSWPICGNTNFCYNTAEDYICCPDQLHVCPPGTYCLQNPFCSPDGLDPETCAEEFGITLEPTPTPTTSRPVIPTTSSSTTSTPTSSSAVTPTETPESPEFTGGADAQLIGHAAAVLGGLGIVGNLLV